MSVIVASCWFMPAYIGLIVGMFIGMLVCFAAEWRVQRFVSSLRTRQAPPAPAPADRSEGGRNV